MKALAYLQVYGQGKNDGDGFADQSRAIELYAHSIDLEIIETFEERGGTDAAIAELRPAWDRMIEQCRLWGVTVIVIEKLARLSPDLMVQEMLLLEAKRNALKILSSCEPDFAATDDPTRLMIRQIAQYQKAQLVLKLREARRRQRVATGRCEGQKPYGTRAGEAEIIAFIKESYAKTGSYNQVALELNQRGIPGRNGGRWRHQMVSRILGRV